MGTHYSKVQRGFTIIEVMLFFAVTGALMAGVFGSATLGVNAQRYNDAVTTFASIVQQEYTNTTNIENTRTDSSMCEGTTVRGLSDCVILGRLMTITNTGATVRSSLIGKEPSEKPASGITELKLILSYVPKIDTFTQVKGQMNWGTKIEKESSPDGSYVSFLILRSPRSGNSYSYVLHSNSEVIGNDDRLREQIDMLDKLPQPLNASEQYMCIDRAGWVASPSRVVKIEPHASGPSGVSISESTEDQCK